MVIELYQLPFSAPCRAVKMVAKLLDLPLEIKVLNLSTGDHYKPEFKKINPFSCIPTVVDDDFVLWESRAIMTYLVNKYSPGHHLYPSDPQSRATVDRWLYWDAGSFYSGLGPYYLPIIHDKVRPELSVVQPFLDKAKLLDECLASSKYLCGDKLTLADLSVMATVTTGHAVGLDLSEFKNVERWLKQLQDDLPFWEELVTGPVEAFRQFLNSFLTAA